MDRQYIQISNFKTHQKVALEILFQAQTLQDIAERLSTAITFAEHHTYVSL